MSVLGFHTLGELSDKYGVRIGTLQRLADCKRIPVEYIHSRARVVRTADLPIVVAELRKLRYDIPEPIAPVAAG